MDRQTALHRKVRRKLCISPLFVFFKREADWIIPWKVPDDPEKDQPYEKSVRQILLPGHSLEVFHILLM